MNLQSIKAAIFDMDGTLIDSMPQWRQMNIEFARDFGVDVDPVTEEELRLLSGVRAVTYYRERFGIETTFEALCERAVGRMVQHYQEGLPLKPGAEAFLRRMKAQHVTCALATATPIRYALIALNRTGLTSYFDFICSTDMIGGHKSDVAFYEKLCPMLGAAPGECAMFEDSLYAMRGAKAAGLAVIGIRDEASRRDFEQISETCDAFVASYDELDF